MFYTENERQVFWQKDQIKYAAKAHEFPCCNVPTLKMCLKCDSDKYGFCENKAELITTLMIE